MWMGSRHPRKSHSFDQKTRRHFLLLRHRRQGRRAATPPEHGGETPPAWSSQTKDTPRLSCTSAVRLLPPPSSPALSASQHSPRQTCCHESCCLQSPTLIPNNDLCISSIKALTFVPKETHAQMISVSEVVSLLQLLQASAL